MATISMTGKCNEIVEALTLLGASDSNSTGFDPLLLNVEKGIVKTSKPNIPRTAFVEGHFNISTKGTGQMVIPVQHTLSRLRKFFSDGEVKIEYDADKGRLTISNKVKNSVTYPPAVGDCDAMPLPFPRNDKGIILFGKEDKKKPSTKIIIDASELKQVLDMCNEVDVDYCKLSFNPDGENVAHVGDEADKAQSPMSSKLTAEVKGKIANAQYSDGFSEVVSVLKGKITLYLSDNSPLWIVQKWEKGQVEYVIAPRIDE